jgi:hypothetical protein
MIHTTAQQLGWDFEKKGCFEIRSENKKLLFYWENSKGYWVKRKYDSRGNEIYWENSEGCWYKSEYNSKNDQIYFESSFGEIRDNRSKTN